ncbi:MAG: hypothetical protein QXU17_05360 [Archaeoglobaceae archaeon]
MGKWRSIDYEKWLKSELRTLESSKINNEDKERIRQYLDFRLANGVSVARASREIICLRLLCERHGLSEQKYECAMENSKPFISYGISASGASKILGIERHCPLST